MQNADHVDFEFTGCCCARLAVARLTVLGVFDYFGTVQHNNTQFQ
jgi:hypothetical protein